MRKTKAHEDTRRHLPSVGKILERPEIQDWLSQGFPRPLIVETIRQKLHSLRQEPPPLPPASSGPAGSLPGSEAALSPAGSLPGSEAALSPAGSLPGSEAALSPAGSLPGSEAALSPAGNLPGSEVAPFHVVDLPLFLAEIHRSLEERWQKSLRRVINATGILLHTNLGRAPLAQEALDAIREVSRGFCDLEYDLDERSRGKREEGIASLLRDLTGAEAALVVNNNAAAVWLAFHVLAAGREAILSRGELVEIGGSFRVPDIMRSAGVVLREVGTTNRTYLRDYEEAISPHTAALIKVHQSNFHLQGFVHDTPLSAIVGLAKKHNLPSFFDLGSGLLRPLPWPGLSGEISISEALDTSVDLIAASGDKLLGGPQCGLLLGRKAWIERLRLHPMARALRICKLTAAALEATLRLYAQSDPSLPLKIPLFAMLHRSSDDLQTTGQRLLQHWQTAFHSTPLRLCLRPSTAKIGGGTTPSATLPSWQIGFTSPDPRWPPSSLERWWRQRPTPVLGRLDDHGFWLDLRTLLPDDFLILHKSIDDLLTFLRSPTVFPSLS